MKIFITGGTGFIGSKIITQLINLDYDIMILSRKIIKVDSNKKSKVVFLESTLPLSEPNLKTIKDYRPEVILDFAWEGIPDFSYNMSFLNLVNHVKLIKQLSSIESVSKFIISGSCWEYNTRCGICNESENVNSESHFTWAKNSIREFLEIECRKQNISYYWTRIFYVYGPNQRQNSIIPMLVSKMINNEDIIINNPNNSCDYIYIDDLVSGIIQIIQNNPQSGIYNFGSGKSTKVIDIVKMVENAVLGTDIYYSRMLNSTLSTEYDFWADMAKSHIELNWTPTIELQEGIKKYINFTRNE